MNDTLVLDDREQTDREREDADQDENEEGENASEGVSEARRCRCLRGRH